MKMLCQTTMIFLFFLCTGCSSVSDVQSKATVSTAYGTVTSNDDGKVIVTYTVDDSQQKITASVPSDVMVLKDSTTLHYTDLQKDEEISISFADGEMSVIQVLSDMNTSSDTVQ